MHSPLNSLRVVEQANTRNSSWSVETDYHQVGNSTITLVECCLLTLRVFELTEPHVTVFIQSTMAIKQLVRCPYIHTERQGCNEHRSYRYTSLI